MDGEREETESTDPTSGTGRYFSGFYPMHLALVSVGDNVLPMAWWTPVSKEPFRFLLAMDRRNHSLGLLREVGEAVLHFFPFEALPAVVEAGYLTGRRGGKLGKLGLTSRPATVLERSRRIEGAMCAFELRVVREITEDPTGDHALFLADVVHVDRGDRPAHGRPLLFLGYRDFATLGERQRYRPGSGRVRPANKTTPKAPSA